MAEKYGVGKLQVNNIRKTKWIKKDSWLRFKPEAKTNISEGLVVDQVINWFSNFRNKDIHQSVRIKKKQSTLKHILRKLNHFVYYGYNIQVYCN